jgi:hypothetical protein
MLKIITHQACPYCNINIDWVINKKERCRACNNLIYVKTRPENNSRLLLTAEDALLIDQQWKDIEVIHGMTLFAKQLGVSGEELENKVRELRELSGLPVTARGAVWSILNAKMVKLLKQNDWGNLSGVYFDQSIFLQKCGEDCLTALRKSLYLNLFEYRAQGYKRVEILGNDNSSCRVCHAPSGQVFTIQRAMETMPIPVARCKNAVGYCRCVYAPIEE